MPTLVPNQTDDESAAARDGWTVERTASYRARRRGLDTLVAFKLN